MKIRNLIAILVCLGVVAFASSTASAFSLTEIYSGLIGPGISAYADMVVLSPDVSAMVSDKLNYTPEGAANYDIIAAFLDNSTGEITSVVEWDEGTENHDLFRAAATADGYLYIVALSRNLDLNMFTPRLLKFGPTGTLESAKEYVIPDSRSHQIDDLVVADGKAFIMGRAYRTGHSYYDIFVTVDDLSTPEFSTYWYGTDAGHNQGKEMIVKGSDIYIASTLEDRSDPTGVDLDIGVLKMNSSDGSVAWTRTIDNSTWYDYFVDFDVDETGKSYLASHFRNADNVTIPNFIILNPADGSIASELTLPVEAHTYVRRTFLSSNWFVVLEAYNAEGVLVSTTKVFDDTLELLAEYQDPAQYIYALTVPTDAQAAAFKNDLAVIGAGRNSITRVGRVTYFTMDGSSVPFEHEEPLYTLYTKAEIVRDDGTTVFMGVGSGNIAWLVLKPEAGHGHTKPVHPGHNTVDFTEAFPIIIDLDNVLTEGTITVDYAEDPASMPAHLELVGDVLEIILDAGYTLGNNYLTWFYSDDALDALGLNIATFVPEAGGWMIAGRRTSHDVEANSITIRLDHFSQFALVNVLPVPAITSLIEKVYALNLEQNIGLDAKLENARKSLESMKNGNRQDAVNKLQAFINECEAQSGNKLTDEQATMLMNEAYAIIAAIEAMMAGM